MSLCDTARCCIPRSHFETRHVRQSFLPSLARTYVTPIILSQLHRQEQQQIKMSLLSQVVYYSFWMAILSFLAGLPAFWILSRSNSSLSFLVTQFTSGLLLSTCVTIVLPEAIAHISLEKMQSSSFGPKILLGFVSLYSIDAFSAKITEIFDHSYVDLSLDQDETNIDEEGRSLELKTFKDYVLSATSNSTTLGLLLHCFTDGIILTTSLFSQQDNDRHSNSILIIISLFLHKLPASFSLTSILLSQRLHTKTVLFHLTLFSISAPIGALVTYLFSHVMDHSDPNTGNSFVLLFSAGAFLYVSFHSFLTCHGNTDNTLKDSQNWSFLMTTIGMLVPVLLSILHDD